MEGLIYRKTVSATLQENINAGKAESKGVELEAEQRFEKWLRLFANYTYTDAKIKKNEAKPETVGKRLTDVPERMFNAGAEFEKGAFSAALTGRYVSKRYSNDENKDVMNNVYTSYDPYFVADAKVSYKLTKFTFLSLWITSLTGSILPITRRPEGHGLER
jgi:iron complex outermembrane receptor protein